MHHYRLNLFVAGHIGVVVPNVDIACERFEKLGVQFIKKPSDGEYSQVNKVLIHYSTIPTTF